MSGSLNKAVLMGNLGKDPDIRYGQDGNKIASFPIATNETWKDKDTGEKKERVEWHRVSIFNQHISELVSKYLKKGSKVYIEGQIQTRKWQDNSGIDKYTTEIVITKYKGDLLMLDSRSSDQDHSSNKEDSMSADDIPF